MERTALTGTEDDIAATVAAYRDAGLDEIVISDSSADMDSNTDVMTRFMEQVWPKLWALSLTFQGFGARFILDKLRRRIREGKGGVRDVDASTGKRTPALAASVQQTFRRYCDLDVLDVIFEDRIR